MVVVLGGKLSEVSFFCSFIYLNIYQTPAMIRYYTRYLTMQL